MPSPKPHKDESEKDFIARCMGNAPMQEEYEDNDQRLAICFSQWRRREGKSMDIERKSVQIEFKDEKEGSFLARIATLNVIDADDDVTLPGAFPKDKEVIISAYQHGSWQGGLPVGKAIIKELDNEVIAEGQFNLRSSTGREHYETIKFSGKLQQWSYGFRVLGEEKGEKDNQKVRFLKKVDPLEIAPVIVGAGIDTGTLAIKAEPKEEGRTYADEAEMALAAIQNLVTRTESLADLRRKEGRVLSTANRERLASLLRTLSQVAKDIKELLDATEPVDREKLAQAVFEYTKIKFKLMEVIK